MSYKVSKVSKAGFVFLRLSFALQIILLILSYANYFQSYIRSTSALSWLSSSFDAITVAAYISVGSCATQFFLIRLFSMQLSGQSRGKSRYLLFCLASVIYDNWYLIYALFKGMEHGTSDYVQLGFGLGFSCLVLIAIMSNSHTLGVICSTGAFAMAAYNIWIISQLMGTVSLFTVVCISVCEALYGTGLALCLLGIRKSEEEKEEVAPIYPKS